MGPGNKTVDTECTDTLAKTKIQHSLVKQYVLDGGLSDTSIDPQEHNYQELFGFTRHQIKIQTNGSPHPAPGSGLLKDSNL